MSSEDWDQVLRQAGPCDEHPGGGGEQCDVQAHATGQGGPAQSAGAGSDGAVCDPDHDDEAQEVGPASVDGAQGADQPRVDGAQSAGPGVTGVYGPGKTGGCGTEGEEPSKKKHKRMEKNYKESFKNPKTLYLR